MKNWDVELITQNDFHMKIRMSGYDYPQDAINAALAQTDGKRVINCVFVGDVKPESTQSVASSDSNIHLPYISYEYDDEDDSEISTVKKPFLRECWNFFVAAWIPTVVLMLVHPVIGISFAVAFGVWWFK